MTQFGLYKIYVNMYIRVKALNTNSLKAGVLSQYRHYFKDVEERRLRSTLIGSRRHLVELTLR